jgi:hypothetical protein
MSTTSPVMSGDYLSAAFIDCALKAGSTAAAYRSGTVQLYRVFSSSKQLQFEPILNFHEGEEPIVLGLASDKISSDRGSVTRSSVKILDPKRFQIFNQNQRRLEATETCFGDEFRWVGSAEAWLFRAIFSKGYATRSGERVELSKDGTLKWSGHTGMFVLGLDHVYVPFDSITSGSEIFGFQFKEGALELFRTTADADDTPIRSSTVTWVLYPLE